MPKLYRVRFIRPDGTEAWLGSAGEGSTNDPTKSPAVDLAEAQYLSGERNRVHGVSGYRYWIVPVRSEENQDENL